MSQLNLVIGHAKLDDYDEDKEKEEERKRKKYLLKTMEDKFKVVKLSSIQYFRPCWAFKCCQCVFPVFYSFGNDLKMVIFNHRNPFSSEMPHARTCVCVL